MIDPLGHFRSIMKDVELANPAIQQDVTYGKQVGEGYSVRYEGTVVVFSYGDKSAVLSFEDEYFVGEGNRRWHTSASDIVAAKILSTLSIK